jgi:hypothetical protein
MTILMAGSNGTSAPAGPGKRAQENLRPDARQRGLSIHASVHLLSITHPGE